MDNATITKKKKRPVYTLPYTRKLSPGEIDELLKNWDYDPNRFPDELEDQYEYEPCPIYDQYGNPTVETMDAMYEAEHGICSEPMTLEEFFDEWKRLYEETASEAEACDELNNPVLLNAI